MTDIKWGPAIAVDGKRPGMIVDGEPIKLFVSYALGGDRETVAKQQISWPHIEAIALPADHPHYRQTEAEKGFIIPAGMMPWHGGEKPIDWSGEAVMFRNGNIRHAPKGAIWKFGWDHSYGMGDIVAYSVATPQADTKPDLTARAPCMTISEVREMVAKGEDAVIATMLERGYALPEPVDEDLIEAREIAAETVPSWTDAQRTKCRSGEYDGNLFVVHSFAGIKRGRALALAGEKEA